MYAAGWLCVCGMYQAWKTNRGRLWSHIGHCVNMVVNGCACMYLNPNLYEVESGMTMSMCGRPQPLTQNHVHESLTSHQFNVHA